MTNNVTHDAVSHVGMVAVYQQQEVSLTYHPIFCQDVRVQELSQIPVLFRNERSIPCVSHTETLKLVSGYSLSAPLRSLRKNSP